MKTDSESGILFESRKAISPKSVVLLVHGMGAHTGRWYFLTEYLQENDVSSYSLELRGFGTTDGHRGHVESFEAYFDDILRLREIIAEENPGLPVFIIGESMGGLICFVAAYIHPASFNGLICISPAFGNRMKFTISDYVRAFAYLLIDDTKQHKMPFTAEMCTRDTIYQEVMDKDDREHRLATSRIIWEITKWQMKAGSSKLRNNLKTSLLFLLAGRDTLVDPKASKSVFRKLKLKDKKLIEYPEMHHALSIDIGRKTVFDDILKWIEERI